MTGKKGFLIYSEWCEAIKDLPSDQFKDLIMALNEYSRSQKEPDIDNPLLLALFRAFVPRMDIDRQNYEDTCKKRAEAIKKRWAKEKETDTKEYKCIQKNTNEYKPIQSDTNDTDLELELDLEQDLEQVKKEKNIKKEKTKQRFVPPTLEEVKAYCQERNNDVNPEKFIAFYQSNGWKVGRNPMKNWKACIVGTWEGNSYNNKAPPKKADRITFFDDLKDVVIDLPFVDKTEKKE